MEPKSKKLSAGPTLRALTRASSSRKGLNVEYRLSPPCLEKNFLLTFPFIQPVPLVIVAHNQPPRDQRRNCPNLPPWKMPASSPMQSGHLLIGPRAGLR